MKLTTLLCLLMTVPAVALAGSTPAEGQPAPDFRLQDQNDKWHTLADYQGQWVALYFYPKADTPGCTTEACNFRDDIFKFKELGVAIVGVSLDDVESQKEFADKYHLPFPLLSDADQEIATRYSVLVERGPVKYASRQTFLIDPDGLIAKHYGDVDPDVHSEEMLKDLARLQTRTPGQQDL